MMDFNHTGEEDVVVFATSLWYIWFWRSQIQFSYKITTPARLGVMVGVQQTDFFRAMKVRPERERRPSVGDG